MAAAGVISTFTLPAGLEAAEPPEARGLRRDEVRLLVSDLEKDSIEHARFNELSRWLSPGDLLVVNTSGTLNAALPAVTDDGEAFELHLSTLLPGGFWTVEIRQPGAGASLPYHDAHAGTRFQLPAGGAATLLAPYPIVDSLESRSRLWMAVVHLPGTTSIINHREHRGHGDQLEPYVQLSLSSRWSTYLERHGLPIRYNYVKHPWPSSMYQTVFATEPGSAEMPSAGRPFTPELVTRLISLGVQIAPLLLHTGVGSLEDHEPPYEEYYRVPRETADRANAARRDGHRVIAVGTTVVRALETVTGDRGTTAPGEGWTNLIVTPERPLRSVSGLITGLHEPHATHLAMLEGIVTEVSSDGPAARPGAGTHGASHLERAYAEATNGGYLWHEFGDSHLILGSVYRSGSKRG